MAVSERALTTFRGYGPNRRQVRLFLGAVTRLDAHGKQEIQARETQLRSAMAVRPRAAPPALNDMLNRASRQVHARLGPNAGLALACCDRAMQRGRMLMDGGDGGWIVSLAAAAVALKPFVDQDTFDGLCSPCKVHELADVLDQPSGGRRRRRRYSVQSCEVTYTLRATTEVRAQMQEREESEGLQ